MNPPRPIRKRSWPRVGLNALLAVSGFYAGLMIGPLEVWRFSQYLAGESSSLMWLVVWLSAAIALASQIVDAVQAHRKGPARLPKHSALPSGILPYLSWNQLHVFVWIVSICLGLAIGSGQYVLADSQFPSILAERLF